MGGLVRATAVLTLAFAVMASQAVAYYDTPGLNGIASNLAGRKVTIRCLTVKEAVSDEVIQIWGASGYVEGISNPVTGDWFPNNYATLAPKICKGLIALSKGHAQGYTVDELVWSTITLTHEAGHLRGDWWSSNEARTQCWAMKHLRSTWNQLGYRDPALQSFLMGWALAQHRALPDEYLSVPCKLPVP